MGLKSASIYLSSKRDGDGDKMTDIANNLIPQLQASVHWTSIIASWNVSLSLVFWWQMDFLSFIFISSQILTSCCCWVQKVLTLNRAQLLTLVLLIQLSMKTTVWVLEKLLAKVLKLTLQLNWRFQSSNISTVVNKIWHFNHRYFFCLMTLYLIYFFKWRKKNKEIK